MKKLTLLVMEEGNQQVALCLEHDITGQGHTVAQAVGDWSKQFVLEDLVARERGKTIEDISPAPHQYWKLWLSQVLPADYSLGRVAYEATIGSVTTGWADQPLDIKEAWEHVGQMVASLYERGRNV
jgi:hypothetical protein